MAIHKLSPRGVATAAPGKYEDGGGLRLVVAPSKSRKWVLRYTFKGRRREMGLGSFPGTGLAEARTKARTYRELAREGTDPIRTRDQEQATVPTFTQCAADYIRQHRGGWRNPKHARQWVSTLKTYVRPVIGDRLVDEIETKDIIMILSPIWAAKNETAKRVQGRMEMVLDYAAAHAFRDATNPARWRGHLDKLLPKPSRVRQVRHWPAMPFEQVPEFMQELQANRSVSAKALAFLILTATRTSEVLLTKWPEIDLEGRLWVIPAERMKARREHRVPLSDQAVELLETLPQVLGNPYVFPGFRAGRPLSNMALLQLMRGLGYGTGGNRGPYVPHGFRSSFRDWTGEVTNYPRDVAEMALAHTIQDKVEAAYRRGNLFEKRQKMMQDWGCYILTGTRG